MPNVKILECPQALWLGDVGYSSAGVCYYMSEYVEEKVWGDVASFKEAVEAAEKAVPQTIINAGKAKNLRDRAGDAVPQIAIEDYSRPAGGLDDETMYRVIMWFGKQDENPTNASSVNHEAIAIAGSGGHAVYFEPNFGFYRCENVAAGWNNRRALEQYIDSLYQPGSYATNLSYRKIRKLKH